MQQTTSISTEPTVRFSDRVENYVKYRPGYPAAVIEYLQKQFGIAVSHSLSKDAAQKMMREIEELNRPPRAPAA